MVTGGDENAANSSLEEPDPKEKKEKGGAEAYQSPSLSNLVVIFLDVDGVLLPFGTPERFNGSGTFPSDTLDALDRIVGSIVTLDNDDKLQYNVAVVLSSTWRVNPSGRDAVLSEFRSHGGNLARYVKEFYDITDPNTDHERQREIYAWLQKQKCKFWKMMRGRCAGDGQELCRPPVAWIAIDDEDLLVGGCCNGTQRRTFVGHVVQTDSHVGLTQADADLAIQVIRSQLKNSKNASNSSRITFWWESIWGKLRGQR